MIKDIVWTDYETQRAELEKEHEDMFKLHQETSKRLMKKYWHPHRDSNFSPLAGISSSLLHTVFPSEKHRMKDRHSAFELMWIHGNKGAEVRDEILAKVVVYRELPISTVFFTRNHLYEVVDICANDRGFLSILLFEHFGQKFKLVVKGSGFTPDEIDALSSYRSDTEIEIGDEAFYFAYPRLRDMFKRHKIKACSVCGHSLGGTLAQRVMAEFYPTINKLTIFCSPGLGMKHIDKFAQKTFGNSERASIKIIVAKKDIVSATNGYYIGYKNANPTFVHATIYRSEIKDLNPHEYLFQPHCYLALTNPKNRQVKITKTKCEWDTLAEENDIDDNNDEYELMLPKQRRNYEYPTCKGLAVDYSAPLDYLRYVYAAPATISLVLWRSTWRTFVPSRITAYASQIDVPSVGIEIK